MKDRELISDQETAVALSELHLRGFIEWQDDKEVRLTYKGIDYAWDLFHAHTPAEMLALVMLLDKIAQITELSQAD